jgi:hypothetical protein
MMLSVTALLALSGPLRKAPLMILIPHPLIWGIMHDYSLVTCLMRISNQSVHFNAHAAIQQTITEVDPNPHTAGPFEPILILS